MQPGKIMTQRSCWPCFLTRHTCQVPLPLQQCLLLLTCFLEAHGTHPGV